jgi:hypothetical protein
VFWIFFKQAQYGYAMRINHPQREYAMRGLEDDFPLKSDDSVIEKGDC